MAVDAGIERRKAKRYVRNPATVERLGRECRRCLAAPTHWCNGGWRRQFSPVIGFLHEDR